MNFYEFASVSPFLTFFLALIVCDLVVGIARAVFSR